jgi:Ser-tRNA(Ala) deacylase AlaX
MKYLGVLVKDDLNIKTSIKQKKEEQRQKKVEWILRDQKLSGHTRYHIFTSLFKSKVSYATNIIAIMDEKTTIW